MSWLRVCGCIFALSCCWSIILAVAKTTDPSEVTALHAIKKSLIDPMKHLESWNKGDPCTSNWTGVYCTDAISNDAYLHVQKLHLLNMNLSGNLAPELGQLSQLQILDFMWNELTGAIPKEIGNIGPLRLLLLNGNKLSGSLPEELGYLANLNRLQIDENNIAGPVPKSFGNLKRIRHLHFNNNSISGQIPTELSNASTLLHLLLDNNNLSGYLPPEFSKFPQMRIIQLDNNNFEGTEVPASYGNLSRLVKLSLRNCNLLGPVPDLSEISNLSYLDLSSNQLNGSIPSNRLSNSITTIDLSDNHLNGSVPESFSDLPDLQKLALAYNLLTGSVPAKIWQNISFSTTSRLALDLRNNLFSTVEGDLDPPQNVTLSMNSGCMDLRFHVLAKSVSESKSTTIPSMDYQFGKSRFSEIELEHLALLGSTSSMNPLMSDDTSALIFTLLQGNPICSSVNIRNIGQFCGSEAGGDETPGSSTKKTANCPIHACPVHNFFEYVPASPVPCFCASPLRIGYRLKSPSFSYFPPYEYPFEVYLTSSLNMNIYQVVIDSHVWEGSRLGMNIKLFPMFDDQSNIFNTSEIQRIRGIFTSWEFPGSDLFGPYEILNFTLLGPYANSTPSNLPLISSDVESQTTSISKGTIAAIVVGAIASAVAISAIVTLLITRRRDRVKRNLSKNRLSSKILMKIDGVKSFDFREMAQATDNFNSSAQVGRGGYGKVYKGILLDNTVVAIKRAEEGSLQGQKEFLTEIELLSRLHHRNLVSLIGYCDEEEEQMLVYEFMCNGTLRDWISVTAKQSLNFGMRLRIALGSAKGILYLHTEAQPPIFHRDIKATNILLDSKLTAKVADFGLSRLAPTLEDEGTVPNHVSTVVKGTPGYLDPEYFLTRKLTDKSDVYSLGVVFLELLTGMHPISHGKNIVREVNIAYESGTMFSIIDSKMGSYPSECVERFVALALSCCHDKQDKRPSMLDVVRELETILKMMPETDTSISETKSRYSAQSAASSSSSIFSGNPYMSLDVSGSDLVSGVIPRIGPR